MKGTKDILLEKNRRGTSTLTYPDATHPYRIERLNASSSSVTRPYAQTVAYTAYDRPASISEWVPSVSFTYDADYRRVKMQTTVQGNVSQKKYYIGDCYEREESGSVTVTAERLFIGGDAYSAPMVLQRTSSGGSWTPYVIGRDYLGSITNIVTTSGSSVAEYSYDAWGRMRDPQTLTPYSSMSQPSLLLGRGYCGHEHLPNYGLINMNARLYDPVLGRFLSPDPYVQSPDFSQNFNRYAYALNNSLKYTDPSGEIFGIDDALFWGVVAGSAIGAYMGGMLANNGQYNPNDWDFESNTTWDYMIGGALVGGFSAYAGAAIAGSGIPFANTFSTIYSSFARSLGTALYTKGRTPVTISFGVASYNFTNGEWGYLGKKENSKLDNLGYGLGALANVSDLLAGFRPDAVDLVTEHSDGIGHSALVKHNTMTGSSNAQDPNAFISVGPDYYNDPSGNWLWMRGRNNWNIHSYSGEIIWRHTIKVNQIIINNYSDWLNRMSQSGKLVYSVGLSSCVTHTSIALNLSGVFNIGLHPFLLSSQMSFWSVGFRPWSFSYYL